MEKFILSMREKLILTEAKNFEETNKVMNYLASRIEDICIEETT